MRAREFIIERKQAKLTKRQQRPTRGVHVFKDAEMANSDYVMYRLGMACAMSDGKTMPNVDAKSWIGKTKAAFPYTADEVEMLKHGYKAVGASYKDLNHGDLRSQELETVNNVSPTAKSKRNKYGV